LHSNRPEGASCAEDGVLTGNAETTEAVETQSRTTGRFGAVLNHIFSFHAVLLAGLATITVFTVSNRFNDPDLWWHLRVGKIIAETHSIPSTDLFSFTAQGHTWIAHEWLAQLSLYGAYAAGGYQGLMLWLCMLASAIFVTVYLLCYLRTRDPLASFLGAVLAWFFATVGLAARPLILGHLFLALELLILELGRTKDRRWFWCLPPLFAVWVNCHGSYYLGLGVAIVYWVCSFVSGKWGMVWSGGAGRRERHLLGVMLAVSLLALFCNPVGWRLVAYPFDLLFRQHTNLGAVVEWFPPDPRTPRGAGLIIAFAAFFLATALRRSELELRDLSLFAVGFFLAVQHQRMLFVFGLFASPLLCSLVFGRQAKDRPDRQHPVLNAVIVSACAAAMALEFPTTAALQQQIRKTSPVAAIEYVRKARLHGPMLNAYIFGGYLIWALPEEKVFIDGRADIYDWTGVFAEYGRWATLSEDPAALLDRHRIRFCLLETGAPLGRVMRYLPGWRKAYSDDVAEVFVR
jgi:hypothetical protein